jgi:hypothetical protein
MRKGPDQRISRFAHGRHTPADVDVGVASDRLRVAPGDPLESPSKKG